MLSQGCNKPNQASALDLVNFINVTDDQQHFEVKYREEGKATGILIIDKVDQWSYDMIIMHADKSIEQLPSIYSMQTPSFGTVDLIGNGNEYIFIETYGGGSGSSYYELNILIPQKSEIITLTLRFIHSATCVIPRISTSDNFFDQGLHRERQFLESVKYEYGYLSEEQVNLQADNPSFAYYFWDRENGNTTDGKMIIRKYKGKPSERSSINDSLIDGNIIYRAYFKGGVDAYDKENDEHYVLFHPYNHYHWAQVLAKAGPYLVIGTRGEDIAIVNVENFHLKRYKLYPEGSSGRLCGIEKIEVLGSKIRINGSKIIKMPTF